jgi:hypothetical protein
VLLWWLSNRPQSEDADLAGDPAKPPRSHPQLSGADKGAGAASSIAATLKRVLVGFGLAAALAFRSASSRVPGAVEVAAAPSRCSVATCPSPR